MDECERIFLQLKAFLASSPVIQKPNAKEPIIVDLVMSEDAISTILVQEVETKEGPVYFVSRVLHGVEVWYLMIEKISLALVITARRIRMYFQNHRIIVRTDYSIMKILAKLDLVGRMIGWAVELLEFQIQYQPMGEIKSQALADFTDNQCTTKLDDAHQTILNRWELRGRF